MAAALATGHLTATELSTVILPLSCTGFCSSVTPFLFIIAELDAHAERKSYVAGPSNKEWLVPIPMENPPQANFVTCKKMNDQSWEILLL